nr:hypothetical protein [Tanacetum cinerariifolium]
MIGRGRDVNTTEVARHTGVEGGMYGGEVDSHKCNISFEQVKEIGEMIGVSWATTKGKSKEEASGRVGSDGSKGVVGAKHRLCVNVDVIVPVNSKYFSGHISWTIVVILSGPMDSVLLLLFSRQRSRCRMIPRLSFRLGIELRGVAIHICTFLEGDQVDSGATVLTSKD